MEYITKPPKTAECMCGNDGFSLLELIAALMLLALLAAIFGMGLVAALQSHEFSRANVRLTQKAQPALARMTRELMELTQIEAWNTSGAHPYILYGRLPANDTQDANRFGIHFNTDKETLLLYTSYAGNSPLDAATAGQGDILVDHVSSFTLNFKSGTNDWTGNDLQRLSHIEVILDLYHPGSTRPNRTKQFRTTVHMRNTTNFGGEAHTTQPVSKNDYSCFISALTGGR